VGYGLGRPSFVVEPENQVRAKMSVFLSLLISVWALAFAKISIAMLLLRILRVSRAWMIFSYITTAFILVIAIITTAIQLTICKPVSAMWIHTVDQVCVLPTTVQAEIIATSALTIVTDVVLSLVPLLFIVHIPTSIRHKIVVAILMSMGLVASFASIFKIVLVTNNSLTGDPLIDAVAIQFWTIVEVQLG
jgi:rhodopsin domain-containing protein